jgi:predicted nucleic acid-binding protein
VSQLFIDTDTTFDLLSERQPFYIHAAKLFSLADKGKAELFISSLCFNNLDYLLSKKFGSDVSRNILLRFKILVTVLGVDDKIITLALNSSFADFEDAIQYYTAIENNIPVIITRNLKDYREALIPVMSAETYLKGMGNQKQI